MEALLPAIQAALTRLYNEAQQASENTDVLLRLAQRADSIFSPLLSKLQKLTVSQAQEVHPAAQALLISVDQVTQVARQWGGRQRGGVVRFVWAAFRQHAQKFRAEIDGAEENLNNARDDLVAALTMSTKSDTEELLQQMAKLQIPLQPQVQQGKAQPWLLRLSDLDYPKTGRGKPKDSAKLGSGGFASVFRATFEGREVAVKEPHDASSIHKVEAIRKAFFREANTLFKLHHRNVVTFIGAIDVDEDGDSCYMLITELLHQTLDQRIHQGPLHNEMKMALCEGVAQGLAYLHHMRIIHRDVKPQNIMLAEDGTPKIIDFGLAKEKQDIACSKQSTKLSGTEAWMSPEKKAGEPSTLQSDVFSFGLVMVFILSQQQPPPSEEERKRLLSRCPPSLALLSRIAQHCSAHRPEHRPTSASLAANLLLLRLQPPPASHQGSQPPPTPSTPPQPVSPAAIEALKRMYKHLHTINPETLDAKIPGNVGGDNPLIDSARNNDVEMVTLLLCLGASVKAVNNFGMTSLICASINGHTEIVKELLKHKATVNHQRNDGYTALKLATLRGEHEVAELLRAHGATE